MMPPEGHLMYLYGDIAKAGCPSFTTQRPDSLNDTTMTEDRWKHGAPETIPSNDFVVSSHSDLLDHMVSMQSAIRCCILVHRIESECLAPCITIHLGFPSGMMANEFVDDTAPAISRGTGHGFRVQSEPFDSGNVSRRNLLPLPTLGTDARGGVMPGALDVISNSDGKPSSIRFMGGSTWGIRGFDGSGLVNSAGTVSYSASQWRSSDIHCGRLTDASPFRSAGRSVSSAVRRVLYVGGYSNTNSSNAPKYGLSYANANNDLSNSNTNIGGRLTRFSSTVYPDVGSAPLYAKHTVDVLRPSSTVLRNEGDENKGNTMPISINNLRSQILDMGNLRTAARQCCSRRRDKTEVARFKDGWEGKLIEIRRILEDGTYETSKYRYFERWEHGKLRKIADLPLYPDRIIRQAFAQVLAPELDRKLIPQTHASRKDHGTHSALRYACRCIRKHPKIRFGMSIDAVKCYESIDKRILKGVMSRMISDRWVLDHLFRFIDDYELGGISIGDSLSPLFCNCYFNEIDHHMFETMKCHAYVAYADNRFIFGNSRKWLMKMKDEIERKFAEYGLRIHSNWHIADLTKEGLDFLGYRIFKDHVRLRKSTKERFIRAMRRMMRKLESGLSLDKHDLGCLNSYRGMLRWCNSKNLYNRYCKPILDVLEAQKDTAIRGSPTGVVSSSIEVNT